MTASWRKSPVYRVGIWIALILGLIVLIRLNSILTRPTYIPIDDFVRYWATGRIIVNGGNPYDSKEVEVYQNSVTGSDIQSDVITSAYIPPWSLPLFALFGIINYPTSRLFFLLVNIIILLISAEYAWQLYEGNPKLKWLSWLITFLLGATISVLEKGQITGIMLFGIVGFIVFHEKVQNDWIAGIFLSLVTWKPQLVYLLWPALILWIIQHKAWKILISFTLGILIPTCIVLLINPSLISDHLLAITKSPPLMWATPTIGAYLRFYFWGIDKTWLQFFPMLLGFIWSLYYWLKDKKTWTWSKQIPLLIFMSLITTSHSWTYDLTLLVLPSIQVILLLLDHPQKNSTIIWFALFFIIQALDLILHRYWDDFWFIWYAPIMLAWYLLVRMKFQKHPLTIERES